MGWLWGKAAPVVVEPEPEPEPVVVEPVVEQRWRGYWDGVSVDDVGPVVTQLSVGSLAGFAAGYALRTVGRMAAFTVGTGFICLQGLAQSGYIDVNWAKVEKDYTRAMDLDNDGVVTSKDLSIMLQRATGVLKYNVPTGVGFTTGMFYGMGAGVSTASKAALIYGIGGRVLLPRVAVAGAAGVGTASVPAFMAGIQERMGWRVISDQEQFNQAMATEDGQQLKSLQHSLHTRLGELDSMPTERAVMEDRLRQLNDKMISLGLVEPPVEDKPKRSWWSWR
mmetsp:Transcript_7360/g.17610  ORF Transcript_7360/g.17610 Transcript_7360/m.17610 type:complete len:279 (+) Transcript_7360:3-839(+)